MRKTFIAIAFVFSFLPELFPQQFPITDNYLVNPFSLSPAFAGQCYKFETYLAYRSAWTGITGAPTVGYLSLDGNIGKNMGLGGTIILNKAGIYRNFAFNIDYAYHLQIAKEHTLSFGINGAIYQNSVDYSGAIVSDPSDPLLTGRNKLSEVYVNAGFSMLYTWKDLNICFAFPLLVNNRSYYSISDTNHLLGMGRNWLFYANYSLPLGSEWKLKFDLLYRATQFAPWTVDFSTLVKFKDSYWLGLFYRKNNIIGVTAGLAIVNSIVINYNYEFSGFAMNGQSGGSHEITLGYRLPFTTKKIPALKDYNR